MPLVGCEIALPRWNLVARPATDVDVPAISHLYLEAAEEVVRREPHLRYALGCRAGSSIGRSRRRGGRLAARCQAQCHLLAPGVFVLDWWRHRSVDWTGRRMRETMRPP